MRPELKSLHSPDLEEGHLPDDPACAEVFVQALIGPASGPGDESFNLTIATPAALADSEGTRWGHGLLIVESFSWEGARGAIEKLLRHCEGETWSDVAGRINRYLDWEFDNYKES